MNLSHFSSKPIEKIESASQEKSRWHKPSGFWVSVDGEHDWPSWCELENFTATGEQYHYGVSISPAANVLHLKSEDEIRMFHAKYILPYKNKFMAHIDWLSVSKKYDGLIIAPYCWPLRLDSDVNWYYSWDCASGCIWNAEAIDGMELVREPVKKAA